MSIVNQVFEKKVNMRKASGLKIYESNSVQKVDNLYIVRSASNPEIVYTVEDNKCDCPDYLQRHEQFKYCKHIYAVKFFEGIDI